MRRRVAPALVLVGLIGAWEIAAQVDLLAEALNLQPYLVPAPSAIAESLFSDRALLAADALVTLIEVAAGFGLACACGFAIACLMHLSPLARDALYPLIVASQTIPIIVIAPIAVVWFGFGIGPKLVIIAIVCFFPIAVNTLDGLASVDPAQRKMMRTLDAGRRRIFLRLELPAAAPGFFTGAKISVAVAVIGAVFGEWAGATEGLGHLINTASSQYLTDRTFAAVFVLAVIAIALYGALAALERRLVGWARPKQP